MDAFTTSIPMPTGINPTNFSANVIFTVGGGQGFEHTNAFLDSAENLLNDGFRAFFLLLGYAVLVLLAGTVFFLIVGGLVAWGLGFAGYGHFNESEEQRNEREANKMGKRRDSNSNQAEDNSCREKKSKSWGDYLKDLEAGDEDF